MCLILFGYKTQPGLPLIVAANRDEFHGRASDMAHFWSDAPAVLAGRDRVAGGTWLGCTRNGRFAALTNFSGPDDPPAPRSRGQLVQNFLTGHDSAESYAHHIDGPEYAGFNLLVFDGDALVYTCNKGTTDVLTPGFYGLSNAELGALWPKCTRGAESLARITATPGDHTDALLAVLADRSIPDDAQLPHRGRPIEMERRVAPSFIIGDEYGTRASTIVMLGADRATFVEQTYLPGGRMGEQVSHEFTID